MDLDTSRLSYSCYEGSVRQGNIPNSPYSIRLKKPTCVNHRPSLSFSYSLLLLLYHMHFSTISFSNKKKWPLCFTFTRRLGLSGRNWIECEIYNHSGESLETNLIPNPAYRATRATIVHNDHNKRCGAFCVDKTEHFSTEIRDGGRLDFYWLLE